MEVRINRYCAHGDVSECTDCSDRNISQPIEFLWYRREDVEVPFLHIYSEPVDSQGSKGRRDDLNLCTFSFRGAYETVETKPSGRKGRWMKVSKDDDSQSSNLVNHGEPQGSGTWVEEL